MMTTSKSNDLPEVPTIKLGTYRHYKDKLYQVVGVALHSETHEALVVYMPLYESDSKYWVRPYGMFIENVELNGRLVPRFEYVGD